MEHRRSSIIGGLILVLMGLVFLVAQSSPDFEDKAWPWIVIEVGAALLVGGILTGAPALAIPACIVGGIGALLFWQNATDSFESWAYAWTLILSFVGLGRILAGFLSGQPWSEAVNKGGPLIVTSLVLFAVFWSFLGDPGLGSYWPLLLIGAGFLLIFWSLFRSRQETKTP